jgi:hypothetical protein
MKAVTIVVIIALVAMVLPAAWVEAPANATSTALWTDSTHSTTSATWAGDVQPAYALPHGAYNGMVIEASWKLPNIVGNARHPCVGGNANTTVSVWIGLGGWNGSKYVAQVGTTDTCTSSGVVYTAWYSFGGAAPTDFPVTITRALSPSATIWYDSANRSYNVSLYGVGSAWGSHLAKPTSAEWIVSIPVAGAKLMQFHETVLFKDPATQSKIDRRTNQDAINMVGSKTGTTMAVGSGASSFSLNVKWVSHGP